MSHMFRRTGMAVLIGALLMSISSVAAQAQTPEQHYRCERRIRRAEANLQRAIDRHGTNSRQAERRRRELAEARAQCQGL
jgi:type II secretory pathway component PulJ